jgi:macrolide transport system ATP-binding/permease protein
VRPTPAAAGGATRPVVAIERLSFRYGAGDAAFWALRDVSLTIAPGELVAITGASGSGKTTLMNLLGTLATTSDGVLRLSGESVAELGEEGLASFRNRNVGFVFQQFHLLPRLSVLDNVLLPAGYMTPRLTVDERAEMRARALMLLTRLGIGDQAHKLPSALSGGQKQRAAIARALLLDAPILLADEPTGALDSKTSREVLRIFADLNAEGRTVILITHDPAVTQVARRRIELRDGRIVADVEQPGLTPEQILPSAPSTGTVDHAAAPIHAGMFAFAARALAPLREAWQALVSSKLRTALTSLGLIIGVSSITTMLTLGSAAQGVILGIFNQAGSDRIYVGLDWRAARSAGNGYWPGLDLRYDLPAMQNTFERYGRVVPLGDNFSQQVYAAGNSADIRVQQLYDVHDFTDKGARIDDGRMIAPHEFAQGERVALVGSEFTDQVFPDTYVGRRSNRSFPIGEVLSLRGNLQTTVTIVGTVKPRDTTFESSDVNQRVYIPMATAAKYTGQNRVTWLAVVPEKGVKHRWLADSVVNYLRIKTGLKFPFRANVPEEIISRILLFIKVFQGMTTLVGGLCILVGGIGIMNIMLVTIAERIREIGLRKALGASGADVTRQFLIECVLLCTASGVVGTLLGSIFCNLVALIGHAALPDTIPGRLLLDPVGIVAGLGTAIGCGLAFGMMPAMKAARLDPSEALRSE